MNISPQTAMLLANMAIPAIKKAMPDVMNGVKKLTDTGDYVGDPEQDTIDSIVDNQLDPYVANATFKEAGSDPLKWEKLYQGNPELQEFPSDNYGKPGTPAIMASNNMADAVDTLGDERFIPGALNAEQPNKLFVDDSRTLPLATGDEAVDDEILSNAVQAYGDGETPYSLESLASLNDGDISPELLEMLKAKGLR